MSSSFRSVSHRPGAVAIAAGLGVALLGGAIGISSVQLNRLAVTAWLDPWLPPVVAVAVVIAIGVAAARFTRFAATPVGEPDRLPIVVPLALLATQFSGVLVPWNPTSAVFLTLVVYWLAYRVMNPEEPLQLTPLSWLFLAFLGVMFISILGRDLRLLSGIFRHAPKFIAPVLLIDLLNSKERIYRAMKFYIVMMGVFGFVGVMQKVINYQTGAVLTLAGPLGSRRGELMRATGLSSHGNVFAEQMLVASMIGLFLLIWRSRRYSTSSMMLIVPMTVASTYFTYSRGAWVAGLVGLVLLPFIVRPRWTPAWLGIGAVAVSVVMVTPQFGGAARDALTIGGQASFQSYEERVALARRGFEVMMMHPVRGAGIRNFHTFDATPEQYKVHNTPLQIGSETGFVGMIIYLSILTWVTLHVGFAYFKSRDHEFKAVLGALLVACLVTAVVNQASPMAYGQYMHYIFALAESAAVVSLKSSRRKVFGSALGAITFEERAEGEAHA